MREKHDSAQQQLDSAQCEIADLTTENGKLVSQLDEATEKLAQVQKQAIIIPFLTED